MTQSPRIKRMLTTTLDTDRIEEHLRQNVYFQVNLSHDYPKTKSINHYTYPWWNLKKSSTIENFFLTLNIINDSITHKLNA